jgi:hypothetical protein
VACEPITASGDGEVRVVGRWVDDVSIRSIHWLDKYTRGEEEKAEKDVPSKPVDEVLVLGKPGGVVFGNDSSNGEEISVVEVVIVVVTVTKVDTRVGCASLVNNTTPRGLVRGESSSGRGEPVVKGSLEVVGDIRDKSSLADSLTVVITRVSLLN